MSETIEHPEETGRCFLTVLHGGDVYGHCATIDWVGDLVTTTRTVSGRNDSVVTTERDSITETALLNLIVAGVRPAPDFSLVVVGGDSSGAWDTFAHLRVRGGQATITRGAQGKDEPVALPGWFLNVLHDFVFGEFAWADREEADAA